MTYYFCPIAEGLGDLLITLPALQALIDTGVPTRLILRSPKQEGVAELIDGLDGWMTEPEFLSLTRSAQDRFINLRDHPLQTENVMGTDKFFQDHGRMTIVDFYEHIARDVIERDLGIKCNFREYVPFRFASDSALNEHVLLVPGSAGSFKCWNTSYWIELYGRLVERSFKPVVVGQPDKSNETKELLDAGLPWLSTPTFADAVNVVSNAKAMICVDTGLMHLSIQQKRPTVSLHLERSIFARRGEPNAFPILAPDCVPDCLRWTECAPSQEVHFRNYEDFQFIPCYADGNTRCMNKISVETVLKTFLDVCQN